MKFAPTVSSFLLCALLFSTAWAADDAQVLPLVTCQDSWMEWEKSSSKVDEFRKQFSANFKQTGRGASFAPNQPTTILGHRVNEVYPDSIGMGVGFSVLVDAQFDSVKASLERQVGKALSKCSKEGDSRSCEYTFAEKKTLLLLEGGRGKSAQTLFGCYYFYAK